MANLEDFEELITQPNRSSTSFFEYLATVIVTLFTKIIPGLCAFIVGASVFLHLGLLICDRILPFFFHNFQYLWTTPIKQYLPYMFSTEEVMGQYTMWLKPLCFYVLQCLLIRTIDIYNQFQYSVVGIFTGIFLYIRLAFYTLIYVLLCVHGGYEFVCLVSLIILAVCRKSYTGFTGTLQPTSTNYTNNSRNSYNYSSSIDYNDDSLRQQKEREKAQRIEEVKENMRLAQEKKKEQEASLSKIIAAYQKSADTVAIKTRDGRMVYKKGILLGYTENEVSIKNLKSNFVQVFNGKGVFIRSFNG